MWVEWFTPYVEEQPKLPDVKNQLQEIRSELESDAHTYNIDWKHLRVTWDDGHVNLQAFWTNIRLTEDELKNYPITIAAKVFGVEVWVAERVRSDILWNGRKTNGGPSQE